MTSTAFKGIKTEFAVPSNIKEQIHPALQVTTYKPLTLNEEIKFCLSENSLNLIDPNCDLLETKTVECVYGRESVLMHEIVSPVRWIFLNIPRIFVQDKKTKEVSLPEKGVKLFGTNKVTIAKCFLACLIDNKLVLDGDGKPQIFTLKLTSSKTQLIGYQDKTESRTILSLNREIQKYSKTKDNLVHLVSVDLQAKVKEFTSTHTGDSSLGVMYELVGNAKVLQPEQQQQIFNLISNEDIRALLDDPFELQPKGDRLSLDTDVDDIDF